MKVALGLRRCGVARDERRGAQGEAPVRHEPLKRGDRPAQQRIAHVAAAAPLDDLRVLPIDNIK